MSLQLKLLLAQAPLAVALVIVGAFAVWSLSELRDQSQQILRDNYRSVLAAQQMKEAIERIDSAALFIVVGEAARAEPQVRDNRARFAAELETQAANITEEGEQQATDRLRQLWTAYEAKLDALGAVTDPAAARQYYFDELEPTFLKVKNAADTILALNQDAMLHKSDTAERLAKASNTTLLTTIVLALLVGTVLSVGLTRRLLRPLSVLTQAVARLGEGDFAARAKIEGSDEIARLADQFNDMAEHLAEYRNSSLGELLLAQRAAQAAIDSIPDPVIVFAADGGVLNVNHAAESLLQNENQGPDELLINLPPELRTALEAARAHVLQGKGPYLPGGFEDSVVVAGAAVERWFLLRASPVYEEKGRINGVTVILQDVTKLRRFDELKNNLVATVAHEFRTPLTSLRMAIHLCLEGVAGSLSDKQADLLYAAREDCERLQRTVDELLDLARIQAGKLKLHLEQVSAADLVHAAVDAQRGRAAEQNVTLETDIGSGLDQVLADPERVALALSNLLTNAIRHTPTGGAVQIRVVAEADDVRFDVIDRGEGVPPEYQSAIFERFFRVPGARSGAAGLGLSLAKEVVEAHQGHIGVHSQSGAGSTFWFTLPLAGAAANS